MYLREFSIPADSEKVLVFLEEDIKAGSFDYFYDSDVRSFNADLRYRRKGNIISLVRYGYFTPAGKDGPLDYLDAPDGDGYEVVRFEVRQFFDNRSNVKAGYEPDYHNQDFSEPPFSYHKKFLLSLVVRLAVSAGADFLAVSAQKELENLLQFSPGHFEYVQSEVFPGQKGRVLAWREGPPPDLKHPQNQLTAEGGLAVLQPDVLPVLKDYSAEFEAMPRRKQDMIFLCIRWANRGFTFGERTMSNFLSEETPLPCGEDVTESQFQRALAEIFQAGYLRKENGRFSGITEKGSEFQRWYKNRD